MWLLLLTFQSPLLKFYFTFLLCFQDLMTLDFFSCNVVFNFNLQNLRNFATTFHLISGNMLFFTKFREIFFAKLLYEISLNASLRNFAKYFSEILRNFAKLLYEISQNAFYEISRNILAKFLEISRNYCYEISRSFAKIILISHKISYFAK
jgi:hypothetical protein